MAAVGASIEDLRLLPLNTCRRATDAPASVHHLLVGSDASAVANERNNQNLLLLCESTAQKRPTSAFLHTYPKDRHHAGVSRR